MYNAPYPLRGTGKHISGIPAFTPAALSRDLATLSAVRDVVEK
jgi:hypothetical protein